RRAVRRRVVRPRRPVRHDRAHRGRPRRPARGPPRPAPGRPGLRLGARLPVPLLAERPARAPPAALHTAADAAPPARSGARPGEGHLLQHLPVPADPARGDGRQAEGAAVRAARGPDEPEPRVPEADQRHLRVVHGQRAATPAPHGVPVRALADRARAPSGRGVTRGGIGRSVLQESPASCAMRLRVPCGTRTIPRRNERTPMAFKLPALPYPKDALQPYISAETLEYHHGKHHDKYVSTLNELIQGTRFAEMPLEEIVRGSD